MLYTYIIFYIDSCIINSYEAYIFISWYNFAFSRKSNFVTVQFFTMIDLALSSSLNLNV